MPNLDTKNISYDTCHLSKATRPMFIPSLSRANRMFDIVYFDI